MKTTIEIPDTLYRRAKVRAAEDSITLKDLVVTALEHELRRSKEGPLPCAGEASAHYAIDSCGWPVLKRDPKDATVVTEELVGKLREEEGV
jgi:hypothetical protein